jgi:hypothetical protein
MVYRGRFVHPELGKSLVEQNSWGAYLGTANPTVRYVKADGSIGTFELPEGCFCVPLTVAAAALKEGDTFALAGLKGWDGGPTPPPPPPPPPDPDPTTVAFPKNFGISFGIPGAYVKQADGSHVASGTFSIRVTKLASSEIPPLEDIMANLFVPAAKVEAFGLPLGFLQVPAQQVQGAAGGVGDHDWIHTILTRLCEMGPGLPEPANHAAALVCWFLKGRLAQGAGPATALPPVVLTALRLVCQYAYLLPNPYGSILSLLCRFVPVKGGAPCAGC